MISRSATAARCCSPTPAARQYLTAWQERKRKEERRHPFLDQMAPLGLVPYLQAQLLARHLRGDLDAYPPWFWKYRPRCWCL